MSTIQKLQHLPHKTKMRIMYISCATIALLLVVAWMYSSQMLSRQDRDTTLLESVGDSINNTVNRFKN